MSEPKRIAQIVGKWVGGGVEAVIMNYYRNIDKSKIQFDFLCDSDSTNIPYEEIESLGGKVILIPPYQKPFKYHKELKRILKENKYEVVHSHINTMSVFPLFAAWCAKVPVRIAHSHATTNKAEWKRNLLKQILKNFSKIFATDYMSCSEVAGRFQFGDRTFDKGEVFVLKNAIDLEKFKYNESIRNDYREKYEIKKDQILIGHVGRFVSTKNHKFIIEIFSKALEKNNKLILVLVGQGPLLGEMKDLCDSLNISDKVLFLGQVEDIYNIYQMIDLFLLPSLYEGLGMAAIEAQVSGVDVICSTNVSNEAKITDLCNFIDLDNQEEWINKLININHFSNDNRGDVKITDESYDITKSVKILEKKYLKEGE